MIKQRIIKYNSKGGKRVGVFVADKIDDKISIGFSLCAKADKFDEEKAMQIAISRMQNTDKLLNVPCSIYADYEIFRLKCVKYFKQNDSTILPFVVYNSRLKKYTAQVPTLETYDKYLDHESRPLTKKEKALVNDYTSMLEHHSHVYNPEILLQKMKTARQQYQPARQSEPTLEDIMKAEGIEQGVTFG